MNKHPHLEYNNINISIYYLILILAESLSMTFYILFKSYIKITSKILIKISKIKL